MLPSPIPHSPSLQWQKNTRGNQQLNAAGWRFVVFPNVRKNGYWSVHVNHEDPEASFYLTRAWADPEKAQRHVERLFLTGDPKKRLKRHLNRFEQLSEELETDLFYAATATHWNGQQRRRSENSIAKKQSEARGLLIAIGCEQLQKVTEQLWSLVLWHAHNYRNHGDPTGPLREQQQRQIQELRSL
jgi:hypothetical protein